MGRRVISTDCLPQDDPIRDLCSIRTKDMLLFISIGIDNSVMSCNVYVHILRFTAFRHTYFVENANILKQFASLQLVYEKLVPENDLHELTDVIYIILYNIINTGSSPLTVENEWIITQLIIKLYSYYYIICTA